MKKNLRRISIVVTAQTKGNLERLAAVCGYSEIGRVVDKLTREKMISLHLVKRKALTMAEYIEREVGLRATGKDDFCNYGERKKR